MSKGKRGRPPGSRNTKTILGEIVARKVMLPAADGRMRRATLLELVIQQLVKLAIGGDIPAIHLLGKLQQEVKGQDDAGNPAGVILVPARASPAEWIRRQQILNKYRRPPTIETTLASGTGSAGPPTAGSTAPPTRRPPQPPSAPPPPRPSGGPPGGRLIR